MVLGLTSIREKRSAILIVGYYGYGNLGDEAILQVLVAKLKDGLDAELIILSANPKQTAIELEVAAVDRWSPIALFKAMYRCRGCIFGGGGLLQNKTSTYSLLYYLVIILLGRFLRRPVLLLGQGLGPINGSLARTLTGIILRYVAPIGCRDEESIALASQLKVAGRWEGDLLFLRDQQVIQPEIIDSKDIVLAVAEPPSGVRSQFIELLVNIAAEFCRDHGGEVILLPFFPTQDRRLASDIAARLTSPYRLIVTTDPAEAFSVIASAGVVISSRLHPLEFAALCAVPVIAIAGDPKIANFISELRRHGGPMIPLYKIEDLPVLKEITSALNDTLLPSFRRDLKESCRRISVKSQQAFIPNLTRLQRLVH
ncbi:polysaccharide pyruvyl transferase CsaB [Candidatus Acetothermia bacterium]|nr:polysaccharide pyruvyl transferase CsaB [Candidatus Acetothermia bacterium]